MQPERAELECRGYEGRQYVQERSTKGIMVEIFAGQECGRYMGQFLHERNEKGMMVASMCRRELEQNALDYI